MMHLSLKNENIVFFGRLIRRSDHVQVRWLASIHSGRKFCKTLAFASFKFQWILCFEMFRERFYRAIRGKNPCLFNIELATSRLLIHSKADMFQSRTTPTSCSYQQRHLTTKLIKTGSWWVKPMGFPMIFSTEATKRRTGTATDVPSFGVVKGQSWNFHIERLNKNDWSLEEWWMFRIRLFCCFGWRLATAKCWVYSFNVF